MQQRRAVVPAAGTDNAVVAAGATQSCGILRRRKPEGKGVRAEGIVNDGGLDEHLREWHVELGDDAFDDLHVRPRGVNEKRTAALVGNDFRFAKQLDWLLLAAGRAGARGAVDDVLQTLLEGGATIGRAVGRGHARPGLAAKGTAAVEAAGLVAASAGAADTANAAAHP